MSLTPGQERCIRTLDHSLVVAAGAGSGKTFTLTKRIVDALQSGFVEGVERICAITFTNKAADELKSRIKAELRACGMAEEALKVDEAWVSTIHGMCARILRAHAIELDLDPHFTVADEPLVRTLLNRAVDDVLREAQAGCETESSWGPAVDALFSEYSARSKGMLGNSVEDMLHTLIGMAARSKRGFESFRFATPCANPAQLLVATLEAYEALAESTQTQKANEARDAWAQQIAEQAQELREHLEAGNAGDARWALEALDRLPQPKKTGTKEYREQVAEAQDIYFTCVMELRLSLAIPHLETLIHLARRAHQLFGASKRAEGVLDNDDLLTLASQAVENHPEIARLYADKFQLVMIDEFQDTDQMQVDMVKKLSGPGARRLCTVGDAQQSIYRFRGADVSVYRRHLREVEAGCPDDVIKLPDNFRSHRDVLSFVDRVFEQPSMFGGEFMQLHPGRDEARVRRPFGDELPRIRVQLTSKPRSGVKSDEMRRVEAGCIADTFADLHAKGHSAGEMALLLGGMTHADVYAEALRARGLACVVSGGSVFANSPEVQVVLDLVHVLVNPFQTQALHNVLTSPLFDLCAQDLLVFATARNPVGRLVRNNLGSGFSKCAHQLREEGAPQEWSAQMQVALRVLGDAIGSRGLEPLSKTLRRVVADSGLLTRLQARGAEGLAQAGNVYKALREIELIERSEAAGPARVEARFEAMLAQAKEAPGALSASGGDFVRIMTVHASKGLEFPIVAVAEFRDDSGPKSKLLAAEVDGTVLLSLDLQNTLSNLEGFSNPKSLKPIYASMVGDVADEDELAKMASQVDGVLSLRATLYEYERMGEAEESKRLLYVALTRAKEALVVALRGERTKDNPLAVPKNCMGAVVTALCGQGPGFDVGISRLEYQGTAPALVEHVALEPSSSEDPDKTGDSEGIQQASVSFLAPLAVERTSANRVSYSPAHSGVFSYSSVADASHGEGLLEDLVDRYFVEVDGGGQEAEFTLWLQPSDDGAEYASSWSSASGGIDFEADDDGSWAYEGSHCADQDKATDLGTAFHRLAQYAVVTREEGPLICPDEARVRALERSCSLDEVQSQRLREALARWFGSDEARKMEQMSDLRAEVPFFVRVPAAADGSSAYLEGEIDLLGFDATGTCAFIVDYKTGGKAYETSEDLALKHILQASCYAYALLLQGVKEVQASFVRVERSRADAPDQPQCVRYRFRSTDLPELEESLKGIASFNDVSDARELDG